LYKIGQLG